MPSNNAVTGAAIVGAIGAAIGVTATGGLTGTGGVAGISDLYQTESN